MWSSIRPIAWNLSGSRSYFHCRLTPIGADCVDVGWTPQPAGRQIMEDPAKPQRSLAFLLQRAIEERHAAANARCHEARLAHRELARRYVAEANALGASETAEPRPIDPEIGPDISDPPTTRQGSI